MADIQSPTAQIRREKKERKKERRNHRAKLDGCIMWHAHNTVLGEEALLIYIVPVCYVKTGRYGKPCNIIVSLHRKENFIYYEYSTNYYLINCNDYCYD